MMTLIALNRYHRDFLVQSMSVPKEEPDILPPSMLSAYNPSDPSAYPKLLPPQLRTYFTSMGADAHLCTGRSTRKSLGSFTVGVRKNLYLP